VDTDQPAGRRSLFSRLVRAWTGDEPTRRYKLLRRNITIIMSAVAIVPLIVMVQLNHYVYRKVLWSEVENPMRALLNKTRQSFQLFLTERQSALSFIASAYTFQDLADRRNLTRLFHVMRQEFGGFVDLGFIDSSGVQVAYVGPYRLEGKQYRDYKWFQEVSVKGSHVSEVFQGYRGFPHFVVAVRHSQPDGREFVLRATIDTDMFVSLIRSVGLEPSSDVFVTNRSGVLQTPSRFYGTFLEQLPIPIPPIRFEPTTVETTGPSGRPILLGYTYFESPSFVLFLVKPGDEALLGWHPFEGGIAIIFLVSAGVIILVAHRISTVLVRRIDEADRRRELDLRTMEHANKLASIGRLATGVAHEINNPMAIINEKAGLMEDLLSQMPDFIARDRFLNLTASIRHSVERCSGITHRLLGFARRMDVQIESIDLNKLVTEVYSFLEKEAFHRNIEVRMELADELPTILSDRGQLQQVFLNILNNAFEAVTDRGLVVIQSREQDGDTVAVSIRDNGIGMSEATKKRLFEPFFTTGKARGTGLGLSITYGIVKRLGGNILVESAEGQGAEFTVLLPRQTAEVAGG
jgi:two-component system, NtrC family, sensor kinase